MSTGNAVPLGWMSCSIRDVGAVRVGRQRSPGRLTGAHSTKYLRAGNIGRSELRLDEVLEMDFTPGERAIYELQDGDVVLAEASGSAAQVGRSAVWRSQIPGCCFQNTVIRFRPHAVTPAYAQIVFAHYAASGVFADAARGTGIRHLSAGRFSTLPFPLPPQAEQVRIAEETSRSLDELAGARLRLTSALRRIDEQVVEVLGAAAAGLLGSTHDARQSPSYASVLDAARAATKDARVPSRWRELELRDCGEISSGKALSRRGGSDAKQRPYLRVANVLDGRVDVDDLKTTAFSDTEMTRYGVRDGDLLIVEASGSASQLGRSAMYAGEFDGWIGFQNHVLRFRPGPDLDGRFALLVLRHYQRDGTFAALSRGSTTLTNISKTRAETIRMPVPPRREQDEIANEAHQRFEAIDAQRLAMTAALEKVDRMEMTLIEAAVTGQLVARDPQDEAADTLLERLGPPPAEPRLPARAKDSGPARATGSGREPGRSGPRRLLVALKNNVDGLAINELFAAVADDVNDVAGAEDFYVQLRELLQRAQVHADPVTENARLRTAR